MNNEESQNAVTDQLNDPTSNEQSNNEQTNDEQSSDEKPPKSKADGTWGQYPKSISRIETATHCAWYVRIYFQGAYVRKTFNDDLWGGQENALREAVQWRNEVEQAMGKPRTDLSVRKKTVVDNRDIGVHRRSVKHVKRGKVYRRDVYEVTWTPQPGKVSRTTVSVSKYGEEEALRRAREIRQQKEKEIYGEVIYKSEAAW